ncbi:MAG: hypothetical protein ACM3NF_08190 [Gemmatimonadota bacterium]
MRPGGRAKRPGSRLLLALALGGAALAALYGGARLADLIADGIGVASVPVRLLLKVVLMAAALPAGFYLIERLFLGRATPRRPRERS